MIISTSKTYSVGVESLFYENMCQSPSPASGQLGSFPGDGVTSVVFHLPGLLPAQS